MSYVFSDKTGTLTKNVMSFKKFSCGQYSYGDSIHSLLDIDAINSSMRKVKNFDFYDPLLQDHLDDPSHENWQQLHDYIIALALCHTVLTKAPENPGDPLSYSASSPDEEALVIAAREFGITYEGKSEDGVITLTDRTQIVRQTLKYKLLHVLEFDSVRKRMSVIVKDLNEGPSKGQIKLICKGADNVITERLNPMH